MRILACIAFLAAAWAGDNSWAKVQELKSGIELRIYKRGAKAPITATSADATDDKLIVVIKNRELAIARDDIDSIEYRPARTGPKMTGETRTETKPAEPSISTVPHNAAVENTSSTTSYSSTPKPDFQILYKRSPAPAK